MINVTRKAYLIISQPKSLLDEMDEWNQNQHGSSGLIDAVKKSAVTQQMAEIETLEFISKYVGQKKSPMCGNTVSHDRRFLIKYMPRLESYFNYRHIDVSSFKEAAVRWMNEAQVYEKQGSHRAMGDIKDSQRVCARGAQARHAVREIPRHEPL